MVLRWATMTPLIRLGLRLLAGPLLVCVLLTSRAGATGFTSLALADVSVSSASADAGSPFVLPGTQPGELTADLRSPQLCQDYHGFYAEYAASETWQGTMMANAARDPLFQAALTIANQDVDGSGDLCIRCHAPRGWLFGRSSPPELATLEEEDFESVQCDFCHRLEATDPVLIGTGQYTVANDFVRRGPLDDAQAPHEWQYSAYHESSELCGLCHDVSNPAQGHFPIERTYTEWKTSDFGEQDITCQHCHMPAALGRAAGNLDAPERTVHEHELAGGNTWMPQVLAGEFPELGREQAFLRTAAAAQRMLESAAALSLALPDSVAPGGELGFAVRVENLTGHKLPTGYPEGRQCWLEVTVRTDTEVLMRSGAYDAAQGQRIEDEQLRTYEVKMAASGVEGFHFVLQDELLQDNRIPPRGFRPGPETIPVGRDYGIVLQDEQGPVLAHWDEAPYRAWIPEGAGAALRVEATLWYQTASREYVEFLRDENRRDQLGERLYQLWIDYGKSPPVALATVDARLTIAGGETDAGAQDGGLEDAGVNDGVPGAGASPHDGGALDAAAAGLRDTGAEPEASTPMDASPINGPTPGPAGSDADDVDGSVKPIPEGAGLVDARQPRCREVDAQIEPCDDRAADRSGVGCNCSVSPTQRSAWIVWALLFLIWRRRKQ